MLLTPQEGLNLYKLEFQLKMAQTEHSSSSVTEEAPTISIDEQFAQKKAEIISEMDEFLALLRDAEDRIQLSVTKTKVEELRRKATLLQKENSEYPLSPIDEMREMYDYASEDFRDLLPQANEVAKELEKLKTAEEKCAALNAMEEGKALDYVIASLKEWFERLDEIAWLPTHLDITDDNAEEIERKIRNINDFQNRIGNWKGLANSTDAYVRTMSQRMPLNNSKIFKIADGYLRLTFKKLWF